MKFFQFSENNSGGSYWLDASDYRNLLDTGDWGLDSVDVEDESPYGLEFRLRHNLVGRFDSYDDARESFESVTGQNLDARGCDCCGRPFRLYETNLEGSFVNDAALRARASTLPA